MKFYVAQDEPRQPNIVQFELEDWIDSSPNKSLLGGQIQQANDVHALLSMPLPLCLPMAAACMEVQ
jgi:hypothetical protein